MDISNSINQKVKDLKYLADQLPKIKIIWEKPILLDFNQINSSNYKEIYEKLLLGNRTIPAIYYFKIVSQLPQESLLESFISFKKERKRTCSFFEKKRGKNSLILYCGSVEKELHSRLVQHLEFGSSQTGSLQLSHWAKDLNLKLEFHFAWLGKENRIFTKHVESALANRCNPLIGKNT